jgi:hypothetical protein
MAKSSRGTPRPASLPTGTLLTPTERRILDKSVGRSLTDATQKQLQATLLSARALRNKWQDLFRRQTVASKRTTRRGKSVNTRSLDKSELFAAAVKRIEARIAAAADAVATAVAAMEHAATRAVAPKATKKAAKKPTTSLAKKAVKKKPTAKAAASRRKAASSARVATAEESTPSKRREPVTAAPSKKARQAGTRKALTASATGQAIVFDKKKQRSAHASATRMQLKLDGLSTRRRGHDIAAGKRTQARRDRQQG